MLLPLHLNLQNLGGGPAVAAPAQAKSKGYLLTRAQLDQIKREDEELIAIITILGEYL